MLVAGIGNVTECNRVYIWAKNEEGNKDRLSANRDRLEAILQVATGDELFYNRMGAEISALYDRKYTETERKY